MHQQLYYLAAILFLLLLNRAFVSSITVTVQIIRSTSLSVGCEILSSATTDTLLLRCVYCTISSPHICISPPSTHTYRDWKTQREEVTLMYWKSNTSLLTWPQIILSRITSQSFPCAYTVISSRPDSLSMACLLDITYSQKPLMLTIIMDMDWHGVIKCSLVCHLNVTESDLSEDIKGIWWLWINWTFQV